jgi:hypothetical protein
MLGLQWSRVTHHYIVKVCIENDYIIQDKHIYSCVNDLLRDSAIAIRGLNGFEAYRACRK